MLLKYLSVLVFINSCTLSSQTWNTDIYCPSVCTCYLEHWKDLSIQQWLKSPGEVDMESEHHVLYLDENNAMYYDNPTPLENPIMKIAMCTYQSEKYKDKLFEGLPSDVQVLTIIQGTDSENIVLKSSYFQDFNDLILLEIRGSEYLKNRLLFSMDIPLKNVEYLNLDHILLESTMPTTPPPENDTTYEIVRKIDNIHSITLLEPSAEDKRIVPYDVYVENEKKSKRPIFKGFENLNFLRIDDCELKEIRWELFEGLDKLIYLYLDENMIKFIPEFAFYGVPKLKILSLSRNQLLDIQLTELSGLLELEYLDLSYNKFSQLSELSFPPFPELKVADFRNNPITVVFSNTFEVMNTTESIVLGNLDNPMKLLPNSFIGLQMLRALKLYNVDIDSLQREQLFGMPMLKELVMSGNIQNIEFDAFVEVKTLERLVLSDCNLTAMSMDSFYGLKNLIHLDLSKNRLTTLPPGLFDDLASLKELMLNDNLLSEIPKGLFYNVPAKMIRLSGNPWHCTCRMRYWNPLVINKVKKVDTQSCRKVVDKNVMCASDMKYTYVYDNRVAPRCLTPERFNNWGVFNVIRKQLRCQKYYNKKAGKAYMFRHTNRLIYQEKYVKNRTFVNEATTVNFSKTTDISPVTDRTSSSTTIVSNKQLPDLPNNDDNLQTIPQKGFGYRREQKLRKYRKYKMKTNRNTITPDSKNDNRYELQQQYNENHEFKNDDQNNFENSLG